MAHKKITLLDTINGPIDLKKLDLKDLDIVADELRHFIIQNVAKTGGHLGASLGAVDLTLALHYLFDSPHDKIIWDVGHQCYAHKILTGRREAFPTLRQYKGLSGFPKIAESAHDIFGAGHASTSISAALGIAKARDHKGEKFRVIAVIGDGSMTGGNALEAINQASFLDTQIMVILNDNRMSISENVGALSNYTHRIETTDIYKHIKETINELIEKGDGLRDRLMLLKSYLKDVGSPGLLFEKLGFDYFGPIDGHDINAMIEAFTDASGIKGPTLVHLRTIKGKGYSFAEENKPKYHGVNPFNVHNGQGLNAKTDKTFTEIFSDTLVDLAACDSRIVAITAAMPDGTGLSQFKKKFPERFFDVGIAEQHAVVFAAGLARGGLKPVCAIYSTFLQRAYDAVIHDVCLQNLPVVFAIDRAGLVGNDGPTHHGCFDISYLRHIPNLVVMAPKDEDELKHMVHTALTMECPVAVRYPRGVCFNVKKNNYQQLALGRAEIVAEGDAITIVSVGTIFQQAQKAHDMLSRQGIQATLINARFVKPMDAAIIEHIKRTGKAVVIEENALQGGFGSAVLEACQQAGIKADIKLIGLPDTFIEHGTCPQLLKNCGLDFESIVASAESLLGLRPPSSIDIHK